MLCDNKFHICMRMVRIILMAKCSLSECRGVIYSDRSGVSPSEVFDSCTCEGSHDTWMGRGSLKECCSQVFSVRVQVTKDQFESNPNHLEYESKSPKKFKVKSKSYLKLKCQIKEKKSRVQVIVTSPKFVTNQKTYEGAKLSQLAEFYYWAYYYCK